MQHEQIRKRKRRKPTTVEGETNVPDKPKAVRDAEEWLDRCDQVLLDYEYEKFLEEKQEQ